MVTTEKLSELEQRRSKLRDKARETVERCEKEDRGLSPEEEAEHRRICDVEIIDLDKRIQTLHRQNAIDRIGWDARSGREPGTDGARLSDPLPHEDPSNTRNGAHRYSLLRAASGFLPGGHGLVGLEAEVSQELQGRSGMPRNVMGFKMPYRTHSRTWEEADRIKRALDSTAGVGSIPTILEADWIELAACHGLHGGRGNRDFGFARQIRSSAAECGGGGDVGAGSDCADGH